MKLLALLESEYGTPRVVRGKFMSDLLWSSMESLGIENWSDDTDIAEVERKMKEVANEIDPSADTEYAIGYARKNFEAYKELRKYGILENGGDESKNSDEAWDRYYADHPQWKQR